MSNDTDSTSILRKATRVGGLLLLAAVGAMTLLLVFPQAVGAEASYVVLSGSMAPAINAGDVVVVQPTASESVDTGDVITFTDAEVAAANGRTDRVTHRVVGVDRSDTTVRFKTKGDANEDPDPGFVTPDQIVGKVWFSVPLVGYAVVFAGTRLGTVLFVVVPGVLLILNELHSLYRDGVVVVADADDEPDEGTD